MQAAGTKGKRCAMPNTRIMMHQPAGGAMGSADEVNIQAAELNRTMKVCARATQSAGHVRVFPAVYPTDAGILQDYASMLRPEHCVSCL